MNKFESLFAEYPCGLTQESVQAAVADILAQHFDENNNVVGRQKDLGSVLIASGITLTANTNSGNTSQESTQTQST